MKKTLSIGLVCLVALSIGAHVGCTKNEDKPASGSNDTGATYVDLGLTSGTKWKSANEKNTADAEHDFYTFNEAIGKFKTSIPSKDQWTELFNECQWTWTGDGYKVEGRNGNSITLPAAGSRECNGNIINVGTCGYFWTSTMDTVYYNDGEQIWGVRILNGNKDTYCYKRCDGHSIRLVQK